MRFETKNIHYYKVGNSCFDSKIDACLISQKTGKPVEWEFACDKVYRKYNWKIEPEQSLDFYYDKRAREIREKYDYIIIAYSGGADSHNMLTSFIRQGLHVDEIFTVHVTNLAERHIDMTGSSRNPENVEAEYVLNVVPKLKALKDKLPNTKITSVDMSDFIFNPLSSDDESWVEEMADIRNIYNLRFDWFQIPQFKNLLDNNSNKSLCVVCGCDKPKTMIKDNNFFTTFTDIAYGSGTPLPFIGDYGYTNLYVEYFYWDTTTTDMLCKQAHSIRKQVLLNPNLEYYWDIDKIRKRGESFGGISRLYHEKWIVPWIYTTWDNGFQANKSMRGLWTTELDDFWLDIAKPKQIEIYHRGLEHLVNKAKKYIVYENDKAQNLEVFFKTYNLGVFK